MKRKKKFLALVLAAVMLLSSITIALAVTTADNVKLEGFDMPDQALVQAFIDSGADENGDGVLTVAEMEEVTSLYADWSEGSDRAQIKNLSGIEVAKNLEYVSLSNNSIEDITPLKSLKSLISVNLDGNSIDAEALYSLLDALTEDVTLHLMQGQSKNINNHVVDIESSSFRTHIVEAESPSENGVVFDTERPNVLTGKETGEYRVIVTFEGTETIGPLVKELTVVVHAPEVPVAEVANNIPELGDWVNLQYYDGDNDSYNNAYITAGSDGITALYPSGELYYIDEAQEIKLSDHAKNYTYVGRGIYPDQVNILEQDGSLWEWRWKESAEQPEKTHVADDIVKISGDAALDTEDSLWISGDRLNHVTDIADLTEDAQRILKTDGTVWENVYNYNYDPYWFKEGCYEQIDQDVKAIINDSIYVKNDNTTWVNNSWDGKEKIAGFSLTDITEESLLDYIDQEGRYNYADFYIAVDEAGAVWKIRVEDPNDCVKIGEDFDSWQLLANDEIGFRTQDGRYYEFNGEEKYPSLRADKSLWFIYSWDSWEVYNDEHGEDTSLGSPYQILSDVEDYRANGGMGLYPHVMVRSDGSIWGYRFNADSKYVPVMVKAPIDKDRAPAFTLGDVNLDGKVNTSDARLALRGAATLETLTDQQILAADVNKNGKADTSDARKILRVAANLDQF